MMFVVNSCRPNSYMKINSFDFITVCIVFLAVTFFVYYMYFNKHAYKNSTINVLNTRWFPKN